MRNTHIVIKRADIEVLPTELRECVKSWLHRIDLQIRAVRTDTHRNPDPRYIVVNMDEPYVDDVIAVLKANGHWEDDDGKVL